MASEMPNRSGIVWMINDDLLLLLFYKCLLIITDDNISNIIFSI